MSAGTPDTVVEPADAAGERYSPLARPVVTGLGVVAPNGVGVEEHWAATLRGDLAITPITRFDVSGYAARLAGQVPDFDPNDYLDNRFIVQTDRWTWFGMAASKLAFADAGYDPATRDAYDTSVIFGAGSGGNDFGQKELSRLHTRGRTAVSVYQSIAWFYAATTGQTSIRHGLKGPSGVVVTDAAGGLDSLAQARRTIRRGTPSVLAGAAESGLTPYALTCHLSSGRVSTGADPRAAYKPFDVNANGYLPGEGGATLLVEHPAAAAERGAPKVYGEIAGYAATHDAHHHSQPAPGPTWLVAAMRRALADAAVEPGDVDVVFADGAGSPDLDALEAAALREVFGANAVPVTAPQGFVGRLCAGGSALTVATALLALRDGVLPAVGNLDEPDPAHGLDLVREPRPCPARVAMVVARGFGGFNSVLVLRRGA
ncbi:beta-ketoacyl synthase N-terminal-like domain-containing protein [Frankia nepalensis]|uniref:Ketosynthase chain-length factor n=2 Tax=Frankia nepalensis TaxID=1836974 RepID=A0A937RNH5_9ACTN|nr:beta-ketoacyl synthase N-terminal-like domain-containing protein [Frankia nepalensis]MBL7501042.1 ketosynthase chain-length factor [Frankia nepalensis]MBL7515762.1 ketosynthase chain-length factor [Frankia nepalensis]MBL7632014.1 ketosynthase chain-length factor [Frankia nepalensis]